MDVQEDVVGEGWDWRLNVEYCTVSMKIELVFPMDSWIDQCTDHVSYALNRVWYIRAYIT